jgi:hypothetical protein
VNSATMECQKAGTAQCVSCGKYYYRKNDKTVPAAKIDDALIASSKRELCLKCFDSTMEEFTGPYKEKA